MRLKSKFFEQHTISQNSITCSKLTLKEVITKFDIPIQELLIAKGLVDNASNLLIKLGFKGKKMLLVTDQVIDKILGQKTANAIGSKNLKKLILQNPKADQNSISQIISQSKDYNCDLIIALGSGTINDLCKLASFKIGIPYIIFASAPSMNGYSSANASIIVDGHKKTLPAHLPLALYFDLDILANAPIRLIKSGIGDSLCFSTCQFDWLLSHLITQSHYSSLPFELLQPYQKQLLNFQSNNINNHNFIELLCTILAISGLGMYISNGSYPASQAEHLIAHYLEMQYNKIANQSFHGEKIAVATLTMVAIQEAILQQKQLQFGKDMVNLEALETIFGAQLGQHCQKEVQKKAFNQEKIVKVNQLLKESWQDIKTELKLVFIPQQDLLKLAIKFNLPTKPSDIGIKDTIYQEALSNAYLIRDRFTSLDIYKNITNPQQTNL